MFRQRVRIESSALAGVVGRVLVVCLSAALLFYGTMLVMLAFKLSPGTVDEISGYRSAFDYLAGLEASDFGGGERAIIAGAGLLVFVVSLTLLWRDLPRPRLARHPLVLPADEDGETEVQPRAVERAAEAAAREDPRVVGVRARYDDGALVLAVDAGDAGALVETLRTAQVRACESLERHGLQVTNVSVTLAGYKGTNRRELE